MYNNQMLNNKPNIPNPNYGNFYGDRFFFFPFLAGGLIGAAAVSLSRPRPVYVTQPYPAYGGYGPTYNPYQGYGYNYGNQGYYNYRY